jgi:flavin reductase (DIM6/NTAB) family NADH-FMN oxidoreductase RutF
MLERIPVNTGPGSKYPEWVVLIVTADERGRVNVMPAGWAMYASTSPCLYAVAVNKNHYTTKLIRERAEFVIAIPGPGMEDAIRLCGSCSGRDVDKVAACGLVTQRASSVGPPLLVGAKTNFECRLHSEALSGDHVIFLGEIVAAWEDDGVEGRLLNFGDGRFALADAREEKTS